MRTREAAYGRMLAHHLDDPGTVLIVSSDFCHWGSRFSYTFADAAQVSTVPLSLPCALWTERRAALTNQQPWQVPSDLLATSKVFPLSLRV